MKQDWLNKARLGLQPVVEKAQHEPHCPWFFTGVTAPLATQSTESAVADSSRTTTLDCTFLEA